MALHCPAPCPVVLAAQVMMLWSSTPHPALHHFQILFKDLFRFLLVYLLFMIGYASGNQPGPLAGGRMSPVLSMAGQGAADPQLHPTCPQAQPLPPPMVEKVSASMEPHWGPLWILSLPLPLQTRCPCPFSPSPGVPPQPVSQQ